MNYVFLGKGRTESPPSEPRYMDLRWGSEMVIALIGNKGKNKVDEGT